jgi:hypothetical protein
MMSTQTSLKSFISVRWGQVGWDGMEWGGVGWVGVELMAYSTIRLKL